MAHKEMKIECPRFNNYVPNLKKNGSLRKDKIRLGRPPA
jgi:hypothetical protein